MTIQMYFTRTDGTRTEGNIYEVPTEQKDTLLKNGTAVLLDLPTLKALQQKVKHAVDATNGTIEELETSQRYESNPSERDHLIAEERQDLDDTIEAIKVEYDTEVATLRAEISKQMFDVDYGSAEERQKADDLLRTIKGRLQSTEHNRGDVLEMIYGSLEAMTQSERAAISAGLPDIEAITLQGVPEHLHADINAELTKIREAVASDSNDTIIRMKQLNAFTSSSSVDLAYRLNKHVTQRMYEGTNGGVKFEERK